MRGRNSIWTSDDFYFFKKDIYWALVELILPKCFKFIWLFFPWVLKQGGQTSSSHRAPSLDTNHQARGEDVEAVPCGRPLTLPICICLIRKAMKNGRHLIQHVVAMAGASAKKQKQKIMCGKNCCEGRCWKGVWFPSSQWGERLERNVGARSLLGQHSCLLLLVNICPLVEAGVSLRLLSCQGRSPEAQMSLSALACLGRHPSSCSLLTSSSHLHSLLHLHAGEERQTHLRKVLDGRAANGP